MFLASSVTPWKVLNIRLNWRMSVKLCLPQVGQGMLCSVDELHLVLGEGVHGLRQRYLVLPQQSSMSLSARKRSLHSRQSISGSEKPPQVAGGHPGLRVHQDGGVQTHVVGASPARISSTMPF